MAIEYMEIWMASKLYFKLAVNERERERGERTNAFGTKQTFSMLRLLKKRIKSLHTF